MAKAHGVVLYTTVAFIIVFSYLHDGVQAQQEDQKQQENQGPDLDCPPSANGRILKCGWEGEPRQRGTFTIVINCLVTLFLCAWTTVQVNIEPDAKERPNRTLSNSYIFKQLNLRSEKIDRFLAKRVVRKVFWSGISLVGPELTFIMAVYEMRTARLLQKQMKKLQVQREKSLREEAPKDKAERESEGRLNTFPWEERWSDISLAYFVVMGGFKVVEMEGLKTEISNATGALVPRSFPTNGTQQLNDDVISQISDEPMCKPDMQQCHSPVEHEPIPARSMGTVGEGENNYQGSKTEEQEQREKNPPRTLTPYGALLLARKGAFCTNLTGNQVRDRSKAGSLERLIVVLQAGWMFIQVIARTVHKLTIPLLEVHVILHVFCSIFMYLIWWGKPVDVELQEPIPVTPELMEELMRGPLERQNNPTNPFDVSEMESEKRHQDLEKQGEIGEESPDNGAGRPKPQRVGTMSPNFARHRKVSSGIGEVRIEEMSDDNDINPDGYLISRAGVGKLFYIQVCDKQLIGASWTKIRIGITVAIDRILLTRTHFWKEWVGLILVGIVYGGAHLATWSTYFPSEVEKSLWRASALVTAGTAGLLILSFFITSAVVSVLSKRKDEAGQQKQDSLVLALGLGGAICAVLLAVPVIAARLFIIVECFFALRRVPENTYETVQWVQFLRIL